VAQSQNVLSEAPSSRYRRTPPRTDVYGLEHVADAISATLAEGSARYRTSELLDFRPRANTRLRRTEAAAPALTAIGPGPRTVNRVLAPIMRATALALGRTIALVAWPFARPWEWTHGGHPGVLDFHRDAVFGDTNDGRFIAVGNYALTQTRTGWREITGAPIRQTNPYWFIELLRSATDVTDAGTTRVRRSQWNHLLVHCDFIDATTRGALEPPRHLADVNLRRIPVKIWVDPHWRLRRVKLEQAHGTSVARVRTTELFKFGAKVNIELPLRAGCEHSAQGR
jgi:hypothetical protein